MQVINKDVPVIHALLFVHQSGCDMQGTLDFWSLRECNPKSLTTVLLYRWFLRHLPSGFLKVCLFLLVTHTRRPDYQHSKDSLKFLLGTMAITEQQMCPQAPFSVIQCTWSQPRHSNPICVTVMHKAHTAHTAHNTHTAHKSHTSQRPSLCPPPTSSVVPTASSDQTPPRRCPPNVSVPDSVCAVCRTCPQSPTASLRALAVPFKSAPGDTFALLFANFFNRWNSEARFFLSVCTLSYKDLETSSKD